MPTSTKP